MAIIDIRFYTVRRNARGEVRARYWQPTASLRAQGWDLQRLSDDENEAIEEAKEYNRQLDAWRKGNRVDPVRAKAGTVEALIDSYKNSYHYRNNLREKTRHGYDYNFKILKGLIGDKQARSVSVANCEEIKEAMARTPAKAGSVIRTARLLFEFGIRKGLVKNNPFRNPGISHKAKKGEIWPHEAITGIAATADAMGYFSIGTAIIINEWCAQRNGDLLALTKDQYSDGAITLTQSKTGIDVYLPVDMVPHIKARLAGQLEKYPESTALLCNKSGGHYTPDGLATVFQKIRREAAKNKPEWSRLTFQNTRHTGITGFFEASCSEIQVAAISGHTVPGKTAILDRYNVRTKQLAIEAFKKRLVYERIKNEDNS
jgi:hypothetical protein